VTIEYDENGNIKKEKGVIPITFTDRTNIKKRGKKGERSYIKLDPRG
jgi:hypothetical protein